MKRSLNDSQLDRLSEFTANLSLVFFASMVTPIIAGLDRDKSVYRSIRISFNFWMCSSEFIFIKRS